MKRLALTSTIVLTVALVMVLTAGIINSIQFDTTVWNPTTLTTAMFTTGYLAAAFSGVVLVAVTVVGTVRGEGDVKKLVCVSTCVVAVGVALILTAAVFGTIPTATWGTGNGSFNPGRTTQALTPTLNTLGYLAAMLGGVVLVATTVATAVKPEKK
ncbi:MAG: hypothetical protein FWD89_03770 [Firmicutes bacterium]|nr:hypothetical protein [Bacillota bacterium]MCL2771401.1 hypothetical protein [Bacillota bacterium]